MTDELRARIPDSVPDDIELFEDGDEVWGRDEYGEFKLDPMTGTATPQDGRCGWPVRHTHERYGETRYCGQLVEATFNDNGSETRCKTHKSAEALMERSQELFKHGYFATNFISFAEKLPVHKFVFAVEMVGGLFEQSEYDFDVEREVRTLDATDNDVVEGDEVSVVLPIPTDDTMAAQANELWTAALKEVMSMNMQETIFSEGVSQKTLADSEGMEGQITDTIYEWDEHHLHLPLSRVAKDIKEHLKNGGVDVSDSDGATVTFKQQDYTTHVGADGTSSEAAEDSSDVAEDFATRMQE